MGTSWTVYNFECADETAREALMEWFETNHPVAFPDDRFSVFAEADTGDGTTGADYAWLDRYLYVTVTGNAGNVVRETADLWERVAVAEFDGTTETATQVTLLLDTDRGGEGKAAGVQFEGVEGMGGNDVTYALAMEHGFRFRSYSAESPTTQVTPHPAAFDTVADVEGYVDDLAAVTGVEPTEAGRELLADDPADDDRYVYGETYGPAGDDSGGVDAVTVVDADTGEFEEYERPGDVPDDGSRGLLGRIRTLLGG